MKAKVYTSKDNFIVIAQGTTVIGFTKKEAETIILEIKRRIGKAKE